MEELKLVTIDEELETGDPANFDGTEPESNPEKIERERNELLKRLVTDNIVYLKDKVAYILNNSVEARNSDIDLAWVYWQTYQSDRFNGQHITRDQMMNLTRLSSIARERARIQNQYGLFLADPEVRKFRWTREGNFKQAAIDEKPVGNGFYAVYIDETGKTQEYLSIGSLWILKHSGASDILNSMKIDDWKKRKGINYEFHFTKMSKHSLPDYREFFEMFLAMFPEVGFKLIVVNNRGIVDQGQAIIDLTYHLLDKGVHHENDSGRAPLSRRLQVSIDEEEKGSDRLKD